jgi:uncharacterized spore protein YtfJ
MSNDDFTSDAVARAADGLAAFTEFGAGNVFAPPVTNGGRTVIACAAFDVSAGFGFGGGRGDDGHGAVGGGSGWGLGGRTQGRPVAVIDISDDGVRVQPVFDWTRLALLAVTTAFGVWRMTRRVSRH